MIREPGWRKQFEMNYSFVVFGLQHLSFHPYHSSVPKKSIEGFLFAIPFQCLVVLEQHQKD
ncbi:hypothetical protein QR98_0103800 [Sarcoptes scabiei]|uniref:Uncharacterized protein n=1 Tax=Sarcoptes scabiei TaxID=52283 RepID=A0A132ALG6_SARSC|nr:hypothetical protein QR98_0103800 [Sarcoptes scabiei]